MQGVPIGLFFLVYIGQTFLYYKQTCQSTEADKVSPELQIEHWMGAVSSAGLFQVLYPFDGIYFSAKRHWLLHQIMPVSNCLTHSTSGHWSVHWDMHCGCLDTAATVFWHWVNIYLPLLFVCTIARAMCNGCQKRAFWLRVSIVLCGSLVYQVYVGFLKTDPSMASVAKTIQQFFALAVTDFNSARLPVLLLGSLPATCSIFIQDQVFRILIANYR